MYSPDSCEEIGCQKQPSYGFFSDGRKRFCSRHAIQGTLNLQRKVCSADGCDLTANYGHGKASETCFAHAQPGMSDPRGKVVGSPKLVTGTAACSAGVEQEGGSGRPLVNPTQKPPNGISRRVCVQGVDLIDPPGWSAAGDVLEVGGGCHLTKTTG